MSNLPPLKVRRSCESWEKQTIYSFVSPNEAKLKITEEHSPHYGPFVTRIDFLGSVGDPSGYWHCSDGFSTFPKSLSFLLPYFREYCNGQIKLLQPTFKYES